MTDAAPDAGRGGSRAALVAALRGADETAREVADLLDAPATLGVEARDAYRAASRPRLLAALDGVDVEALRGLSPEGLRISALPAAGVRSVADVLRAGPHGLDAVPGIGPESGARLAQAAERVAAARAAALPVVIDPNAQDPDSLALASALVALDTARDLARRSGATARAWLEEHAAAVARLRPATAWWRWLLSGPSARDGARAAAADLDALVVRARTEGLREDAGALAAARSRHVEVARADLRARAARYTALLESVAGGATPGYGSLPADLVARVRARDLDLTLLRADLRPYQDFGARYALAQRRVILGDEMGLGKTVQALAVVAHAVVREGNRALVVCPAGLVATWAREATTHGAVPVAVGHGPGGPAARERWRSEGGLLVVPYTGLMGGAGFGDLDVLVVDEAHYVKNPETQRSRAVAALTARSARTLFLTGTPMENRVEEFRTLVGYLAPDVAEAIDPADGAAGPEAFRRAVAPVYLRRNAEDVLRELPEVVQVDAWVDLGTVDGDAYRRAVAAGAFPAMRRAAFAVERPEDSAKVRRLVEIVDEALAGGRKVVVFSYFRDVVDLVARALGERSAGVLTGAVGPAARQDVIDAFVASPLPLALVSQIEVGGVGLNLQAASVVVLCEPQLKPTAEAQAIARVHRMGQVEVVRVYRLLATDTVDEELLRLLGTKEALFDAYARRSSVAEAALPEGSLARLLVASEQSRYAASSEPQDGEEWGSAGIADVG